MRSNRVKRYVRSTNTKIRRIDKAYLQRLIATPSQSILSSKHFVEKCMSEPGMSAVPASKPDVMADMAYLRDVHYNHKAGTGVDPVEMQRLLDKLKAEGLANLARLTMKPEYQFTVFDPKKGSVDKYYHAVTNKPKDNEP